jgi:hypothetical protein
MRGFYRSSLMRSRWQMIRILWFLYQKWRQYPALRLGQLIENVREDKSEPCPFFYWDDDLLVEALRGYNPPRG